MDVEIGTPPQKFKLTPDTMIANTYVYSKKCWSLPCFFYDLFDTTKSTTFLDTGYKFGQGIISHVHGYFGGSIVEDTVKLSDNINIKGYKFGLVDTISGNDFVTNKVSGHLGLAYKTPLTS